MNERTHRVLGFSIESRDSQCVIVILVDVFNGVPEQNEEEVWGDAGRDDNYLSSKEY